MPDSTHDRRLNIAMSAHDRLHPLGGAANTVDLVRTAASRMGVDDVSPHPRIAQHLGEPRHLVFVLLDGLGMNVVEQLGPDDAIAAHVRMELRAICPSTTAAALTSIATGAYPTDHAVTGWFTHLPELGCTSVILKFIERRSERPLTGRGVTLTSLMPAPALTPRMNRDTLHVVPAEYCDSEYTRYTRGDTAGHGYTSLPSAIDHIIQRVRAADGPTYTYLYVADIDTLEHEVGPDHERVLFLVHEIGAQLTRLARDADATVVATADHGQVHIPVENRRALFDGDALGVLLEVMPSGTGRMPLFHVRDGCDAAFRELFEKRYADRFALLPLADAEALQLLGPGPCSDVARQRFGDYLALPRGESLLRYYKPGKSPQTDHTGHHGGLSPQEMRVPLIVMNGEGD